MVKFSFKSHTVRYINRSRCRFPGEKTRNGGMVIAGFCHDYIIERSREKELEEKTM